MVIVDAALLAKGKVQIEQGVGGWGGGGGDETGGDVDAGMIIDREEENLFLRSGPPLVNGTLVPPKLADVSPAKTADVTEFGDQTRAMPLSWTSTYRKWTGLL